eukprot:3019173-Rhodomonas_salina.2
MLSRRRALILCLKSLRPRVRSRALQLCRGSVAFALVSTGDLDDGREAASADALSALLGRGLGHGPRNVLRLQVRRTAVRLGQGSRLPA